MSDLKNKRSEVWKHFKIVNDKQAKCSYCNKILSYGGGATANLSRHLKSVHKSISIQKTSYGRCKRSEIFVENPAEEVSNFADIPSCSSSSTSQYPAEDALKSKIFIPSTSRVHTQAQDVITNFIRRPIPLNKSKQLDEQLIRVIVKEYQPFKVVEDPEFKKFVSMLCPTYKMPDRKTISNSLIPRMYNSVKEEILQKLLEVDAVCLTTDGWTSLSNESFIAITAHFIDSDKGKMFLKSYLLGCFPFNERHTAKNLSEQLKVVADEYALTTKISCIVSDNAANIKAAIRMTNWRFFACFAHTLNLVLQNAIREIKVQVDKVKAIVQFFKCSSSALAKLKDMQKQMGLPELKLKQDVVTRWNSTYDMISRLITVKNAVVGLLAIDQPHLNTLLPSDWIILEKSVEILKLFNDITEEVSAEKSVTISKIILFVNSMNKHLNRFLTDSIQNPPEVTQLLTKLISEIKERFKNVELNELTTQATFLDPRFKKYGFSSMANYEAALKSIKSKIASFHIETSLERPIATEATTANTTSTHDEKKSSIWEDFDDSVKNVLTVENPVAASIIEVDKYINEPLIRRTEDPLHWWEERKNIYPRLYILMRRRLCIVATSVPCERIFSKAAETISEKRSRLKPEKAAQILFLNHNL